MWALGIIRLGETAATMAQSVSFLWFFDDLTLTVRVIRTI
jgi:hypothetical protein